MEPKIVWTAVSAVAGAISAIAALFTVWNARKSAEEERKNKRVFFTISEPGIKPLPDSPPFRVQITLENTGVYSATDVKGILLFVESDLSGDPDYSFEFSIGNVVDANAPTPWYNDGLHLPNETPPHFVVLGIKYLDVRLRKEFSQCFFMKWHGVTNGETHPDFVHVSIEEKEMVTEHLRDELAPYLDKEDT
ncbi:hypothetical protein [Salinibacter grassmerensis]|uniref:hypothetical protein n=1 Tax=Salinibacter grassmerensis TaxID=3040353 RepID=UPI0021E7ED8C|nr:hypothetical protein [Salinibacter grassmerensis]